MESTFLFIIILFYLLYLNVIACHIECCNGYIENNKCYSGPMSFLQYLLFPISINEFINDYWDKKPLFISREFDRNYYDNFKLDKVYDDLLQNVDVRSNQGRFEEIRAIKYDFINNMEIDLDPFRLDQYQPFLQSLTKNQLKQISEYHKSLNYDINEWDAASFGYLLSHGYTLRFFQTELFSNFSNDLVKYFKRETGINTRTNFYITPKYSKAFSLHHDVDDIFILQINGQKNWTLYGHSHEICKKIKPKYNKSINLCEKMVVSSFDAPDYRSRIKKYVIKKNKMLNITMKKGDLLIIPRGNMHEANNIFNNSSIHISLGIYTELNIDYLYHFINTISQTVNINLSSQHLWYKQLSIFLRQKAFEKDNSLRKYLPYNFIQNDHLLINDKIIKVCKKYLREFLMKQMKVNADEITNIMTRINLSLSDDKIKNQIKLSLKNIYSSNNNEFSPKVISLPMRYRQVRKEMFPS